MAEVRAPYLQLIVRHCQYLPDGQGARILARVPAADLARIRAAALSDWLPFALHTHLQDAKNAVMGERAAEVTRNLTFVTLGSPLLGGFVANVLRALSADPRPAFRWLPRAYEALFRDAGRLVAEVDEAEDRATLRMVDLPPEVAHNRAFIESIGHATGTIHKITGTEGACVLAAWEPEQGCAVFEVRWR